MLDVHHGLASPRGDLPSSPRRRRVAQGTLSTLRATEQLAASTTACPPWCDGEHELTGDERGVSHQCVISTETNSSDEECDARHVALDVHLRAKEPVDAPGTLGPTELVVFTDATEAGWMIEIPADVRQLQALRDVVTSALAVVEREAVAPAPSPTRARR